MSSDGTDGIGMFAAGSPVGSVLVGPGDDGRPVGAPQGTVVGAGEAAGATARYEGAVSMDAMWDGFAGAVVRLELSSGDVVLEPRPLGDVGVFPFDAPVHIVTAYNPAGLEVDEAANRARHRSLGIAVSGLDVIRSVGSAPDGSMPEPGFGLLGVSLDDALGLARDFGQRAIYRWACDALTIVGVDEPHRRRQGWSLSELR